VDRRSSIHQHCWKIQRAHTLTQIKNWKGKFGGMDEWVTCTAHRSHQKESAGSLSENRYFSICNQPSFASSVNFPSIISELLNFVFVCGLEAKVIICRNATLNWIIVRKQK
jgi:hypothetical protein